jgi:CDP-diacylglycerol pyrophosphatase
MKDINNNKSMTFQEALQDPSLAHVHDAIRFLEKTDSRDIFPKKYEHSMIDLAVEDAIKLFETNPNMQLKTVISTILSAFDDDISADLILKMTKNIIKEWHSLSTSLKQKNQTAVAA